ncbi:unnamed protein product [Caenorhabditis angaria]|uniref:Serpentine receptor class gamma n=1 Tax=Caenorhabditis angaria TaxID=860376 RepID=A0A9P1IA39_9PELO|nr:unnamed protein product [Caenorhabditis angaria]
MMSTRNVEQKVFAQLIVTAIFYGLISIFYEIAVNMNVSKESMEKIIEVLTVVNIINYLPEISLPLMLMLSTIKFARKPKQNIVVDVLKTSTSV